MNKSLAIAAAAALTLASCHSSESAYKKAYEKAQAAQSQEAYSTQQYAQTTGQQNAPVQVTAVTSNNQNAAPVDYSNVSVRSENVTLVSGAGLRAYSVVVGSFGMQSNAEGLQATLRGRGMNAQIVKANVNGSPFYRVVATTFDTKNEAAASRAQLINEFPGTWLLYQK